MEITVRIFIESVDKHSLIRLEYLDYGKSEESYNLWIQSPFANCEFMNAEYTLKNMVNYYEWIGDMPIKGLKEETNYFKKSGIKQTIYKIQF